MYPNALETQSGLWLTYGRQIPLIDKPNDMPKYRVNVNWSTSAPMEGFFMDKDQELSKRAQRLKEEQFSWYKEVYMSMHHRIEEQQKKIDNSKMLGTAGALIEEELRQLKLERQTKGDQLLETKRLLEYAGKQEAGGNIEETVGGEYKCFALVVERECLAREMENDWMDSTKLRSWVRSEQTSKKVIQSDLEAINAQSLLTRTPNFYELPFLPQGATTRTIQKNFKILAMLCHPGKIGREDMFKILLQAKKIMEDEKARNI